MPEAKGVFGADVFFPFRLYALQDVEFPVPLHLLMGTLASRVAGSCCVPAGPVRIAPLLAPHWIGIFLWILYSPVASSSQYYLAVVFRMADAIAPDRGRFSTT